MPTDHETRLYELFQEVVRLPEGERTSWLGELSQREPALSAAISDLLAQDARASRQGFLNTPLDVSAAASSETESQRVGQRVGAFVLTKWLAAGGMSHVYLAAREDDFAQQVAVKLIRAGLISAEAERRFVQERQLLAELNHPHIARLLDGGTTQDGRPYLVMEYIAGEPITAYCRRAALPIRRRLELFRQVCLAVHHAHQRLIIHRDIKPGNVLVTKDGTPKLLDFGIARVLDASSDPGPTETRTGQILGTPAYMSPEQAEGNRSQDIRTDVYALGVIGYEMLAGQLPYSLKDKPLLDQLAVVRTEEPVRLGKVNAACRGDVETIVARALEKDPARRYQSASDLADDIDRSLNEKPIQARPPSLPYVLRKLVRRNPVVAGALLVLLVAGFIVAYTISEARVARAARNAIEAALLVQEARRDVQRGEFDAAVSRLGMAIAIGHPLKDRLRIDRAKILLDLDRTEEGKRELEEVARTAKASDRASALLYLGDMQTAFAADKGLALVTEAKKIGLTEPGEQGFAAGLLAGNSNEAIAGFTEALRADPTHRRANEMLLWTLLLLGRRDEAKQRLAVLQAYYPADGRQLFGAILLAAYEPDDGKMKDLLKKCQTVCTPAEYELIRLSATSLHESLDPLLFLDREKGKKFNETTMTRFVTNLANRGRVQGIALPPLLQQTFSPFFGQGGLVVPGDPKAARRQLLEQVVKKHPEGTLYLMIANLYFEEENYKASLVAAEKALETPALLKIRLGALQAALLAEAELYLRDQANYLKPHKEIVRQRLQALIAGGGLNKANYSMMTALANGLPDHVLAYLIAQEYTIRDPKLPHAWDLLGIMERKRKNYIRATELFRHALELGPNDKDRVGIEDRLKSAEKLAIKQAADLLARPDKP